MYPKSTARGLQHQTEWKIFGADLNWDHLPVTIERGIKGLEIIILDSNLLNDNRYSLSNVLLLVIIWGKRSTPFGHNMGQKEYSFWSQNRTKGVVEQYSWALSGLMRVTLSSSTWCPVWWCPAMDICLEILVMFDSSLYYSTQGHLISFVYFVILKASRW